MTDPYVHLVTYDLGPGPATTVWAVDVEDGEHYRTVTGYKGQETEISWTTPHVVKPKPREEAPGYVVDRLEDCDPSEVEKGHV